MTPTFTIRSVAHEDNEQLKDVVQTVLREYGGDRPGTAYFDDSLNNMFAHYEEVNGSYYVAVVNNQVVGGAGIGPLPNADPDICELQKMYILKDFRGQGIGKKLMEVCLKEAQTRGFKRCYIETFGSMHTAQKMYGNFGFEIIDGPMGSTTHSACDVQMMKKL